MTSRLLYLVSSGTVAQYIDSRVTLYYLCSVQEHTCCYYITRKIGQKKVGTDWWSKNKHGQIVGKYQSVVFDEMTSKGDVQ